MALIANDVIYPDGDLLPSMFPDGDIQLAVSAWLADAAGRTTVELAQRHWVYYRAYSTLANRIAATPSSDSGFNASRTVSWGGDRITAFEQKAAKHLAEYSRLSGDDSMSSTRPASLRVY